MLKKFKDKHLAGGYISITKSVIEKLPFIMIKKSDQDYISERSKYIHNHINELEKKDINSVLKKRDEIDKKVISLF